MCPYKKKHTLYYNSNFNSSAEINAGSQQEWQPAARIRLSPEEHKPYIARPDLDVKTL
jgi:hypothetical protein